MLKAQLSKERLKHFVLLVGVELARIEVPHPYGGAPGKQPTLTMSLQFIRWAFYLSIYKPANLRLNRKQRRQNHLH